MTLSETADRMTQGHKTSNVVSRTQVDARAVQSPADRIAAGYPASDAALQAKADAQLAQTPMTDLEIRRYQELETRHAGAKAGDGALNGAQLIELGIFNREIEARRRHAERSAAAK